MSDVEIRQQGALRGAVSLSRLMNFVYGLLPILLGTIACALSLGCSINGYGLVTTHVERADGAVLYTHNAPGLQVRIEPGDVGASLGFTRRLCIGMLAHDSPIQGWYFGLGPPPPEKCYARDLATWGGELRLSQPDLSLGFGLRRTIVMGQATQDESLNYLLTYNSRNTGTTRLEEFK